MMTLGNTPLRKAKSMLKFQPTILSALGSILLTLASLGVCRAGEARSELARGFSAPPSAARPWVYWFWLNGNITRHGITADLEAMRRVGIGGVLIMEVDQGTPPGPARFASPPWRELFKHVCAEADRLGLKVNMNNDAGWCGSGGPWITPELAMQKVTWTETAVEGPRHFQGRLPGPHRGRLLPRHRRVGLPHAGRKRPHPGLQRQIGGRFHGDVAGSAGCLAHRFAGANDFPPAAFVWRPACRATAESPGTCRKASGRSCDWVIRRPAR